MNRKTALHVIILFAAVAVSFFWVINELLNYYSLQVTAILMLILFACRRIIKPITFKLVESTVSTISVLLVISATGGLSSSLFFLNYFLLFELSLLLEPVIPLLLAGILICFYFLTISNIQTPLFYALFLAFPFMTPLAYIFGNLYKKEENQKREIRNLNKKVEELEEELVEEELRTL